MKIIPFTLFIFLQVFCYGQDLVIDYKVTENKSESILSTELVYRMQVNDFKSAFYNINDSVNQFKYSSFIEEVKDIGELKRVKLSDNHYGFIKQDFYYKDYKKDTLIFNEVIFNKKIILGESINLMQWELVKESDTLILNQKCKKAVTSFRGRNYIAFYSEELSRYGGPWKFDGLPGVILAVRSNDGYFEIEPIKVIRRKNLVKEILNPYKTSEIVSWNNFREKYKKRLRNILKQLKSMSEQGEEGSVKIEKIEDLGIKEMSF